MSASTSPYQTQQLFPRLAAGEEAALRELFEVYHGQFFPYILTLVKTETDAREIVQEVMLKCWLQREELADIENPGGWLRTVTAHTAYNYLRGQARYELRVQQYGQAQADANQASLLEELDARATMELIHRAAEQLPSRQAQVFQLSKIEGYSRKEIAGLLGISENTVRNLLTDAMKAVQAYLAEHTQGVIPLAVLLTIFS